MPFGDLQYYAEHGMLEIRTWLDLSVGELFRLTETIEGKTVPLGVGFDKYHDYAILEPVEVRKIFRASSKTAVHNFRPLSNADIIRPIHHSEQALLAANDLVVSSAERDRFEEVHGIDSSSERPQAPLSASPEQALSFSGRAGTMWRIVWHFQDRCRERTVYESLNKESEYLASWASTNIKAQSPKAKSIRNAIRAKYREYTSSLAMTAEINTASKELI